VLEAFKKMLGIAGKSAPTGTPPSAPAAGSEIAGPSHPYAHVDAQVDAVFAEARDSGEFQRARGAAATLLAAPADERAYAYIAVLRQYDRLKQELSARQLASTVEFKVVDQLLASLNRPNIDWSPEQLESLLTARAAVLPGPLCIDPRHSAVIRAAESAVKRGLVLTPASRLAISRIRAFYDEHRFPIANPKLVDRMRGLLEEPGTLSELDPAVPWAQNLATEVNQLEGDLGLKWRSMLSLAGAATGSKPTLKFLKAAAAVVNEIGAPAVCARLVRWFDVVCAQDPGSGPLQKQRNASTVSGLVWMSALPELSSVRPSVVELALFSFRKVPNVGAVSTRVGNACIVALAAAEPIEAVRNLETLRARVRYPRTRALIDRALAGLAERAGMGRCELEDLSVPMHGLSSAGIATTQLGTGGARVTLQPDGEIELIWMAADGAPRANVPAALKREAPEGVKRVQREVKELERTLKTQAMRLESTLLQRRHWSSGDFNERILKHPVLGSLARRLIWTMSAGSQRWIVMPFPDGFIDASGSDPHSPSSEYQVCLWHPIDSPAAEVLGWRRLLENRRIVQPFKQAHREIYVLTEAELATETYSNRFAAHILKQHQLAALCQARGWAYRLQGAFDSWNAPTRQLPDSGDSVEFLLDTASAGNEQSAAGIFLYVSTDQVRFMREREPIRLAQVAPRIFSEVMRDVDLFIGVCSVGNDPTWRDGGPEAHRPYWQSFAFGALNTTAELRRTQLERLIPALTIGKQLSLDGKFLVVRGKLRTYKIHLGSANILMEPNDQYLCIVQGGRGHEKVYLPFDGDNVLPLILSKALLLAADEHITDRSIVSQIRRT
jgi:hypothetical protein